MKIKVYTNLIYGGWSHSQYETGIGGSEEKLIELVRFLSKRGDDVTVYMNGEHGEFDGVKYQEHKSFKPWEPCDVFISFKNVDILSNSINASRVIFYTTEILGSLPKYILDSVDHIVTISNYHRKRMADKDSKITTQYLWFDGERMNMNKVAKEKGSVLYSSSFDRGLEELLVKWDTIKGVMGVDKLYITYGWDFINLLVKSNPGMQVLKERLDGLMKRKDVVMLGKVSYDEMCQLYWRSEYWCLPLNNPDSELFCINAVKAQFAGCKPLVRRAGALQETVNNFIPWEEVADYKNFVDLDPRDVLDNQRFALGFNMNKKIQELIDNTF